MDLLTTQVSNFSAHAWVILAAWLQPSFVEHVIDGLRKAGMTIDQSGVLGGK